MDFEEQEEEMEMSGVPPGGYDSLSNSSSGRPKMSGEGATSSGGGGRKSGGGVGVRYRECLKNHAVSIGGHAVDGCGEFMPSGEEGTLESLKCAACGCHRNFHRKETDPTANVNANTNATFHHHFPPYYRPPPPQPLGYVHHPHRPLALPPAGMAAAEEYDASNPSSSGGGSGRSGGGTSRKRYRTKFTAEQKEKMLEFAEKLGWRIQRHDDAAVEQFCTETGVKRHVLKIWMHNNKNTLGKKP